MGGGSVEAMHVRNQPWVGRTPRVELWGRGCCRAVPQLHDGACARALCNARHLSGSQQAMLQGFSYSALKKILSMRPWLCLLCHRPLHPAADLGISAVPPGIGNLRKLEGLQMEGCPLAEPLASLYRSVPLLLVQVHNPALTSLDLSGLGLAEVSRACACAHGGGCGRACVHTRACVYTLTRDGREGLRHGCRRGHVGKRGACQKGDRKSVV